MASKVTLCKVYILIVAFYYWVLLIYLHAVDCSGYIPRWQFKFGRTYKDECGECLGEFDAIQRLKDCDKLSALAYPKPLPSLDAVTSDANVRDYLNELHNNTRKLTWPLCFDLFCLRCFLFMAAHSNGQAIVFLPCGFFCLLLLSSIYLFFLA